jgi:hypothetical protein
VAQGVEKDEKDGGRVWDLQGVEFGGEDAAGQPSGGWGGDE